MKTPLWIPSEERKRDANISRFINHLNEKFSLELQIYSDLYRWSVKNIPAFWEVFWDYAEIRSSRRYDLVVDDLKKFPGAKWFAGARLNFAENLLRFRDDHIALIFHGENILSRSMTYAQLYREVARLASALHDAGIVPGDRIVAYMPNLIETAVAMLATTAVGAVWASCATDIGPQAALDRLGQIGPTVLFTVDGYFYKGKVFDARPNAVQVARGLPSLKKVVVARYIMDDLGTGAIPNAVGYDEFISKEEAVISFEQLPFDHPVYIMFSSGTTGKPKCMVQGAGVLVNHIKEHRLHSDLKRNDRMMYITTCSWMMWNWLLSGLATGATVVLYDGNPNYPDAGAMWKLIEDEKISIFGCSATYINFLKSENLKPGKTHELSSLKQISQTGSPLSAEGFEYIYRAIKDDVHFNSISGGTDINGCFAIGNPISPVFAGELQGPGLAMKINAYDEHGRAVRDQKGELVCEAPSPSMPLYFWNDRDNRQYRNAYFDFFPRSTVWRHGDYIEIHSDTGGITFLGRSDSTLKPSGVRIGTAEIYAALDKVNGISDSLAIGQEWKGDQRIILFVKVELGTRLTEDLITEIKREIKENVSPRHVPALVLEVPDIPYTFNMKKVESAVTNIVNRRPVTNRDALINPESLDFYTKILPQLEA
ncbi:MAG TPA: acetoacetate--CoA ligase [Candidatus Acidoferrales bacterium]|nr:acetoacetate--CoA ligase [Candidatus Acidoferrales bacterium]